MISVLPSGRVLNRFSKDVGQLDSNMPWTFVDFIQVSEDLILNTLHAEGRELVKNPDYPQTVLIEVPEY